MYYRIDISKGTDLAKSNNSKEWMVCQYWLVTINHDSKFSDYACHGCHDLTMLCLDKTNNAIIAVEGVAHHCIIHDINKSETINLLISRSETINLLITNLKQLIY